MGSSSSKIEKTDVLRLCKERNRFIKQAIDSRYALASAHLSYVESLRSIGIALRRFAEAEILAESSLSTSATDLDKTPSHSSYPSPSPPHNADASDSPLNNESPFSPRLSTMSYMRSGGTAALTVRLDPSFNRFVDDEALTFPAPPPLPPPESGSSWDFFDPTDSIENVRFHGENRYNPNLDNFMGFRQFRDEEEIVTFMEGEQEKWGTAGSRGNDENFVGLLSDSNKSSRRLMMANGYSFNGDRLDRFEDAELVLVGDAKSLGPDRIVNGPVENLSPNASLEKCNSKRENAEIEKDLCAEREDASEFITHRAKDFLSSIKDIEHRFFRTSESGKDVLKMLEANKIQFSYSERGGLPTSVCLAVFHLVCCRRETAPVPHETPQHVGKVITWNRSTSSRSSSSKNPLAPASKDDIDDSGSDFVEEFCMIAGSHSSTLDRLYAWERKLYDEVKASESIRKEYERKCNQLRHQFAKDLNPRVIDKTRAVVKDLHSQLRVALHAVDSISKRIEKLRDEELQPQLVELVQGLIRMWKTMLECHHAQYITISLAYHARRSTTAPESETHKLAIANLQHEMDIFGSSFANWIDSHRSYVEALHRWLHNCILQPRERFRGRNLPFSPRRAVAPPIFVLCRDWLAGIQALPYEELSDSIKIFLKDLDGSFGQQAEDRLKKQNSMESQSKVDDRDSKLSTLQASLTRVFDRLTKFSESSRKMYEDIRQSSEAARVAYTSDRIRF